MISTKLFDNEEAKYQWLEDTYPHRLVISMGKNTTCFKVGEDSILISRNNTVTIYE